MLVCHCSVFSGKILTLLLMENITVVKEDLIHDAGTGSMCVTVKEATITHTHIKNS